MGHASPRFVGWLPALGEDGTGWLPLRASSFAVLARGLVGGTNETSPVAHELAEVFRDDPSLCIWTVARMFRDSENGPACKEVACKEVSIERLASWWCVHARALWIDANWLSAPEQMDLVRWNELDAYFHSLPLNRWLSHADLWLQEAQWHGRHPELSETVLVDAEVTCSSSQPLVHQVLSQIASLGQEAETLQSTLGQIASRQRKQLAYELAYGLSHEINNPLTSITTRAQSLLQSDFIVNGISGGQQTNGENFGDGAGGDRTGVDGTNSSNPVADSLQRIVDQSYRAHAMIADLMFYAHPPEPAYDDFDLTVCLRTVCQGFEDTADRQGIRLSLREAANVVRMCGDREMIGDAISALIRNSIDSIGCDGAIEIVTKLNDNCVTIEVADTGPGLTPQQAAQAMDPFFSGREAGRGLGLGLCRVQATASRHGGCVEIIPALVGCVVKLTLPVGGPDRFVTE